jgi:hypothetical protein
MYKTVSGNVLWLSFVINGLKEFQQIFKLINSYSTILPPKAASNTASYVVNTCHMLT